MHGDMTILVWIDPRQSTNPDEPAYHTKQLGKENESGIGSGVQVNGQRAIWLWVHSLRFQMATWTLYG
jgi:hypothetical protein